MTIKYRVYRAPEGGVFEYCGEFDSADEAARHAEKSPEGGALEYLWETHRAAKDGVPVPDLDGVEDEEALSWHGAEGWHCVVRVTYDE